MFAPDEAVLRDRLLGVLREMPRIVVAFSGGIDSTLVAKAAFEAKGKGAVAVTADSASVPRSELADAIRMAESIGIPHRVVKTEEFTDPDYLKNDGRRCYFCKSELYDRLRGLTAEYEGAVVVSGTNMDDLGDYRPGLAAAKENDVRHPLVEAGITKAQVRSLAKAWGLPTWDKPAGPCLSSRIAPGVAVTTERTARIEYAEAYLHELGLRECRVRLHEGELARIEVPVHEISRLAESHGPLTSRLRELGFKFVTLDLEGFRSGSLNALIDLSVRGGGNS